MSQLSEQQLDQLIAAERAREQEPLNEWRTIAARAREEGLIRGESGPRWSSGQPWLQAAAAVLLLIGGIAIGRTTIGLPTANQSQNAAPPSAIATNPPSTVAPTMTFRRYGSRPSTMLRRLLIGRYGNTRTRRSTSPPITSPPKPATALLSITRAPLPSTRSPTPPKARGRQHRTIRSSTSTTSRPWERASRRVRWFRQLA